MFWNKRKADPVPREKNLFREAFLPPKSVEPPKRPSKRLFQPKSRHVGIFFLWILFFGSLVYVLFLASFHSIGHVKVSGSYDIPASRLERFLQEGMDGKRFFLFPKDNFFLFSTEEASAKLLEAFPKLRSADVRRRFPDVVEATVSEREKIVLWCVSGNCSLLGDDGRARDARFAEQEENARFLIRIDDLSGREVSFGDTVIDGDGFSRFSRLEQGLRESGVVQISSEVSTPSRVSGEFRFMTTEGWYILASTVPDPETTLAELRIILSKEITEEKRPKLRYIDLRTEKKAFYSLIQEEPIEDAATGKK